MDDLEKLKALLPQIEEKIGYTFSDKSLLILSLTHRSFINEYRKEALEHNERLEFLGDSILGLAVSDYLYHKLPNHPEGKLSELRSRLVDASACAEYLQKLALSEFILLGKGELMGEGRTKVSILSDVFEALLAAVYLDGGIDVVKAFLLSHFEPLFDEAIENPTRNFKAELQDFSQKTFQKTPVYKVVEQTGPDHARTFHVVVLINDQEAGMGVGASKKEAEQNAAFAALEELR